MRAPVAFGLFFGAGSALVVLVRIGAEFESISALYARFTGPAILTHALVYGSVVSLLSAVGAAAQNPRKFVRPTIALLAGILCGTIGQLLLAEIPATELSIRGVPFALIWTLIVPAALGYSATGVFGHSRQRDV